MKHSNGKHPSQISAVALAREAMAREAQCTPSQYTTEKITLKKCSNVHYRGLQNAKTVPEYIALQGKQLESSASRSPVANSSSPSQDEMVQRHKEDMKEALEKAAKEAYALQEEAVEAVKKKSEEKYGRSRDEMALQHKKEIKAALERADRDAAVRQEEAVETARRGVEEKHSRSRVVCLEEERKRLQWELEESRRESALLKEKLKHHGEADAASQLKARSTSRFESAHEMHVRELKGEKECLLEEVETLKRQLYTLSGSPIKIQKEVDVSSSEEMEAMKLELEEMEAMKLELGEMDAMKLELKTLQSELADSKETAAEWKQRATETEQVPQKDDEKYKPLVRELTVQLEEMTQECDDWKASFHSCEAQVLESEEACHDLEKRLRVSEEAHANALNLLSAEQDGSAESRDLMDRTLKEAEAAHKEDLTRVESSYRGAMVENEWLSSELTSLEVELDAWKLDQTTLKEKRQLRRSLTSA